MKKNIFIFILSCAFLLNAQDIDNIQNLITKVSNTKGKTVLLLSSTEDKQSVNISNLQNGIYFVKVNNSIKKFIKR